MQVILNGSSYRPATLAPSAIWHVVEALETLGWKRVASTATLVSLVKG